MASRPMHGRDLTQGSIGKTLLAFALPTLVSSILQSLNGTVNAIWIGRFLGESAQGLVEVRVTHRVPPSRSVVVAVRQAMQSRLASFRRVVP